MRGIQTTKIVCVGRILETGIWVLQNEYIGHVSDSKSAQKGQAACPCWATCLPHLGKRRAQIELILYVITHPAFQTEESARSIPFLAVSVLRFLSYIYMFTDIVIECCRCVPSLRQGHKSLSSANHPDNWLTIGWRPTICLSEYYSKKPDNLTVFEQFMLLQRIKRYLQLLLRFINID